MKTYSPKPEHVERRWYVVDASEQVLGRLASEVAAILRGKHKPIFAPHVDTGDHVIVVNADKIVLTGGKETKKVSYRHSGYPGGISATRYDRLLRERPVYAVEKAIKGMLPKNRLGRSMITKLHVIAGPEHPHGPQKPVPFALGDRPAWGGLPEPKVRTRPEPKSEPSTRPAKKATARKPTTAKKNTAKKTTAKKTPGKKATAKKATAKKATAKTTASTTAAKKTTAKKTTARTSTAETTETEE
jgi:large subunit ribosomal protein L13